VKNLLTVLVPQKAKNILNRQATTSSDSWRSLPQNFISTGKVQHTTIL